MEKKYKIIDVDLLNSFIDGSYEDDLEFITNNTYEDMYMTIYEDLFSSLEKNSNVDEFANVAAATYMRQNELNARLHVTSGENFDQYLFDGVIYQLYKRFAKNTVLKLTPSYVVILLTREKLKGVIGYSENINHVKKILK